MLLKKIYEKNDDMLEKTEKKNMNYGQICKMVGLNMESFIH